jgi:hypothetical protein
MQSSSSDKHLENYRFPQQKLLCDSSSYSHELLHSLLDRIYQSSSPFTGYIRFADQEGSLFFLFFFYGAPYAAGRFANSKPVLYSINELARKLAKSADGTISATLCETDPVLLKNMLLFLQEEPAVKAPPSLLDFEYIVRLIGESGENAMIALSRNRDINFFYFKEGKGAIVHYADPSFERPEGMTFEEEMLLYAFQPGDKVQAYIFRDMHTTKPEDASRLDKPSLYNLLTVGYLEERRSSNEAKQAPADQPLPDKPEIAEPQPELAMEGFDTLIRYNRLPGVVLQIEAGPLQGEKFTVILPCSIGRKDCDFILDDRLVSRRHAELKIVDNKLIIEDLESKNGTKVNNQKISNCYLSANDLISIGETKLRISPE